MPYEVVDPSLLTPDTIQGVLNSSPLGIVLGQPTTTFPFATVYSAIKQAHENLKTLLLTRKGERYMQPNYGTDLLEIIFEPNTNELKPIIQDIIIDPISYWLPYITIQTVDIVTAEDDPSMNYNLKITINYDFQNFSRQSIVIFASDNSIEVQ
jgi:phage baseplate assembly protein W